MEFDKFIMGIAVGLVAVAAMIAAFIWILGKSIEDIAKSPSRKPESP